MQIKIEPYWLLDFTEDGEFILQSDSDVVEGRYYVKQPLDRLKFWLEDFLNKPKMSLKKNTLTFGDVFDGDIYLKQKGYEYLADNVVEWSEPPGRIRYYIKDKDFKQMYYSVYPDGTYRTKPKLLNEI